MRAVSTSSRTCIDGGRSVPVLQADRTAAGFTRPKRDKEVRQAGVRCGLVASDSPRSSCWRCSPPAPLGTEPARSPLFLARRRIRRPRARGLTPTWRRLSTTRRVSAVSCSHRSSPPPTVELGSVHARRISGEPATRPCRSSGSGCMSTPPWFVSVSALHRETSGRSCSIESITAGEPSTSSASGKSRHSPASVRGPSVVPPGRGWIAAQTAV